MYSFRQVDILAFSFRDFNISTAGANILVIFYSMGLQLKLKSILFSFSTKSFKIKVINFITMHFDTLNLSIKTYNILIEIYLEKYSNLQK